MLNLISEKFEVAIDVTTSKEPTSSQGNSNAILPSDITASKLKNLGEVYEYILSNEWGIVE